MKITSEQVKEDIEFIEDMFILIDSEGRDYPITSNQSWHNIKQYIEQQDTHIKELSYTNQAKFIVEMTTKNNELQSKLDAIKEQCNKALDAFNEIIFNELDNDREYYYKDKIELIRITLKGE